MDNPEKLGKYRITGVLGKGAMGVVYKGFDPDIRRTVAVKTIRRDWPGETDHPVEMFAQRFRHEAQAAGRLTHPGIVGIHEYGEDAGFTYIAMEYVEGHSLREYFARKVPFAEKDAVSLMSQLLEGLAAAHEQGVWHRDIKPANLIVTSGGRLKIADFGVARIDSSELTQVSEMLGTHGYIAPECYKGLPVDHRTDLFAAGAVFYQLLTGEAPFSGPAEQVMYRVCNIEPVLPSQRDPRRNWPHYDQVVLGALAKEPARRFPSADAFRESLLEAYAKPVVATISEQTIISPVAARDGGPAASRGGSVAVDSGSRPDARSGAGTAATGGTGPMPSQWDSRVVVHLETCLARFVGPVARVMVRRAAREVADLPALIEQLASQLESEADRRAFVTSVPKSTDEPTRAALERSGHGATDPSAAGAFAADGSTPSRVPYAPEPAQIELATRELSRQQGPIARLLVKRAAAGAGDLASFHQAVAQHVEDEAARRQLLLVLAKG